MKLKEKKYDIDNHIHKHKNIEKTQGKYKQLNKITPSSSVIIFKCDPNFYT